MALQVTESRKRSWFAKLCIASAIGVALSVLESGYRLGFDQAVGLFGVLAFVPLIPLIGLRLKPSTVRTNLLLVVGTILFIWVWGLLAIAALFEPLAIVGLWHSLTVFGFPFAVLFVILLALIRPTHPNGKGAI